MQRNLEVNKYLHMLKKNHFLINFFEYAPHVLANWMLIYLSKAVFVYLFPNPSDTLSAKFIQLTFSFLFYGCIALTALLAIAFCIGLFRRESIAESFKAVFSKQGHITES